ncbi:MauE/DoxX family redox-associated membrane protein [Aurantivibrio infirmus]
MKVLSIRSQKILFSLLRWFFIVLLLTSAIGKLLDIVGFAAVIATYQFGIPSAALQFLALGLALFELFLGLSVLAGRHLRLCVALIILMHIGYLAIAIVTNLRGIALENCGCFGVFFARPMTWVTVVEDGILVLMSWMLFYLLCQRSLLTGA